MFKINAEKWHEIVYYINNFYLPVQYTNGRGIYPDRLSLSRSRTNPLSIDAKDLDFAIVNARALDSRQKILITRESVENFLRNPALCNSIVNNGEIVIDYTGLLHKVAIALIKSHTTDFEKLNDFIISIYKKFNKIHLSRIVEFRNKALTLCIEQGLMSQEFCEEQMNRLIV